MWFSLIGFRQLFTTTKDSMSHMGALSYTAAYSMYVHIHVHVLLCASGWMADEDHPQKPVLIIGFWDGSTLFSPSHYILIPTVLLIRLFWYVTVILPYQSVKSFHLTCGLLLASSALDQLRLSLLIQCFCHHIYKNVHAFTFYDLVSVCSLQKSK